MVTGLVRATSASRTQRLRLALQVHWKIHSIWDLSQSQTAMTHLNGSLQQDPEVLTLCVCFPGVPQD